MSSKIVAPRLVALALSACLVLIAGCATDDLEAPLAEDDGAAEDQGQEEAEDAEEGDEGAVADFYSGNTIRLVVGFPPGGSYDQNARLFERFLSKHIPGNPNVLVQNMPGAGGMVSVNNLANTLPDDGTYIGTTTGTAITRQLFDDPTVEFDATEFHSLGSPSPMTYVLGVSAQSGFEDIDEVMGQDSREIRLGAGALAEQTTLAATLFADADYLDTIVDVVMGYEGAAASDLAIEQGEVDGKWSSYQGFFDKIEAGDIVPLAQWVEEPHEDISDLPNVIDLAEDEDRRAVLRYAVSVPNQYPRQFVVAPGVPEERVKALREAFEKTINDPDFLAEAESQNVSINPLKGQELEEMVADYLSMPEEIRSELEARTTSE